MKKMFFLLFVLNSALYSFGQQKFTLTGHIEGLKIGDTLRFAKLDLPNYIRSDGFEVVVKKDNAFAYKGEQPDMQFYSMRYFPKTGETKKSTRLGLSILINKGKYTLTGNADFIYFLNVTGGDYDNELFRKMNTLDDSLQLERSKIRQLRSDSTTSPEVMKSLTDQLNNFNSVNETHFLRLKNYTQEYRLNAKNSNLIACNLATESVFEPMQKIIEQFNNLTEEVKNSRYGNLVSERIDLLKSLQRGAVAPEFRLQNENGAISLSDFKGKHLLIYYFGMCPGSLEVNQYVTKFYNKHNDKINVIGVIDDFETIRTVKANADTSATLFGVNLYQTLTKMLNQDFFCYDLSTQTEKTQIKDTYIFGGLPFFVLIDPEGKMISRGFWDTFFEANELFDTKKVFDQNY